MPAGRRTPSSASRCRSASQVDSPTCGRSPIRYSSPVSLAAPSRRVRERRSARMATTSGRAAWSTTPFAGCSSSSAADASVRPMSPKSSSGTPWTRRQLELLFTPHRRATLQPRLAEAVLLRGGVDEREHAGHARVPVQLCVGAQRTVPAAALPTGVAYLPRYAAVSATATHRYLDALAVVDDPAPVHRALDPLVQPVRDGQGRASRAFNSAAP